MAELSERVKQLEDQIKDIVNELTRPGLSEADRIYWQKQHLSVQDEKASLVKQQEQQRERELLLLRQSVVQQLSAEARAGVSSALTTVNVPYTPSIFASMKDWHRHAYNPIAASLENAAYFGFRPQASLPANIPPELVSPVFGRMVQAAAGPAEPPPNLGSQFNLLSAVHELLVLGSYLSSTRSINDGMSTARCNDKVFALSLLECKSDVGSGHALAQALRYYQQHYEDGKLWRSHTAYGCDPLPAIILLLEGPLLSFHAVWTIYGNRIGYAPLTPGYYLANEGRDTGTVWRLMSVLPAYKQAAEELRSTYLARAGAPPGALERAARLRAAAQVTVGPDGVERGLPCTLPYSLLDESLQLEAITFLGPTLLYKAQQRLEGGGERRVLIKFVEGRYGAQVHRAWHGAGVAPELLEARRLPHSSYTMVVMELLGEEEGWMSPSSVPPTGREGLVEAVRNALQTAHATPLLEGQGKGVHGDMRRPNIMVKTPGPGGRWLVRFIDFDWSSTRSINDGMSTAHCNDKVFVLSLLECKSDVGSGHALAQALRYYQQHYEDGKLWRSHTAYGCDPLPAIILLLEGPLLSFHAVWTIYGNRIGYAPLTPGYYLANEGRDTGTVWRLMSVLPAYKQAAEELRSTYLARAGAPPGALERAARLRAAAQVTVGPDGVERGLPCTLPYSLLDESLQLEAITFLGPTLLYKAQQRLEGGGERRVLIKFVEGRYGAQVHRAWHGAGVAPELLEARRLPHSSYTMVVMELLGEEEGWMSPSSVPPTGREGLVEAVRNALQTAHATPLLEGQGKGVHGDMRRPNIMVKTPGPGGRWLVRFIDFDWAGPADVATYPLVALSRSIPWPAGVEPGATMLQEHDTQLLKQELARFNEALDKGPTHHSPRAHPGYAGFMHREVPRPGVARLPAEGRWLPIDLEPVGRAGCDCSQPPCRLRYWSERALDSGRFYTAASALRVVAEQPLGGGSPLGPRGLALRQQLMEASSGGQQRRPAAEASSGGQQRRPTAEASSGGQQRRPAAEASSGGQRARVLVVLRACPGSSAPRPRPCWTPLELLCGFTPTPSSSGGTPVWPQEAAADTAGVLQGIYGGGSAGGGGASCGGGRAGGGGGRGGGGGLGALAAMDRATRELCVRYAQRQLADEWRRRQLLRGVLRALGAAAERGGGPSVRAHMSSMYASGPGGDPAADTDDVPDYRDLLTSPGSDWTDQEAADVQELAGVMQRIRQMVASGPAKGRCYRRRTQELTKLHRRALDLGAKLKKCVLPSCPKHVPSGPQVLLSVGGFKGCGLNSGGRKSNGAPADMGDGVGLASSTGYICAVSGKAWSKACEKAGGIKRKVVRCYPVYGPNDKGVEFRGGQKWVVPTNPVILWVYE
ncbi:hypothetical protein HYH03_016725 [Edaphochlamys debaryana]|uniref:Uncharacterized protein n=1 Tax=Edaphochlamys debaryana TaxID=47281 RepID=A0A836BPM6_9CHLO|nr:hypothetical protein HYH03_016725 [Edaphochlamys debaryana]|eukprot:KAG2484496.1 hypothetical protein HYH03_016725 [Edaphochlamys debaryana]